MMFQHIIDMYLSQRWEQSETLREAPEFFQIRITLRIRWRSFVAAEGIIDYSAIGQMEMGTVGGTGTISWVSRVCTQNLDVEIEMGDVVEWQTNISEFFLVEALWLSAELFAQCEMGWRVLSEKRLCF